MTSYLESQGFLIVTLLKHQNYIENQNQKSQPLTVTLQIFKPLRFGELAVNTNSPICSVVKLWRISPHFTLRNVFISLQHVLQNICCFCVDLILALFISHVSWKLNIIKHPQNTFLGVISDINLRSARFLLNNSTLLQSTFGYDKSMINDDK